MSQVEVDTIPSGADVYIAGDLVGSTPHTINVDPLKGQRVTLKLSGYADRDIKLNADNPNPKVKLHPLKKTAQKRQISQTHGQRRQGPSEKNQKKKATQKSGQWSSKPILDP